MNRKQYKKFKKICSLRQNELKEMVIKELYEKLGNAISQTGFVYAEGEEPVLLVAHMDTVHEKEPTVFVRENGALSSPQGIGGDDRCGVYMVLKILEKVKCSVLFTENEEVGGIGAKAFAKSKLADSIKANYIVELDRKGKNDAVFYDCDNPEFTDMVTSFGFEEAIGTYSDICDVAPKLKAAAVNISCGYYNQHTTKEYVILDEMMSIIDRVAEMIEQTKQQKYEYIEAQYDYYSLRGFKSYSSGLYDLYDLEDCWDDWIVVTENLNMQEECTYVTARSEDEAVGIFLRNNPHMPYAAIVDCYPEYGR